MLSNIGKIVKHHLVDALERQARFFVRDAKPSSSTAG